MNKTRLLLSLVVAVIATFVALRHQTLRHLEAEQTQFRQQIEEATELRAAIARTKTAPPAPTSAALSTTEHLELLRLRNEVGQLRRELAAESNQMTIQAARMGARPVPVSAYTPAEEVVTKAQQVNKGNWGRVWGIALRQYASENADQLPSTLADASKFAANANADDFELVVTGKLSAIKFPSRTIALREKQPWKSSNGKWGRVYGFTDGHVEVGSSATEDFTEWERQKTQINPAPTQ